MITEVIVQNAEEAKQAEYMGADRLELVSAMSEGGLTPSHGTIKQVLHTVGIPVQIMIRPHSYHFCYSEADMAVILEDVKNVLNLGGNRFVFGGLNKDNTIDEKALMDIIKLDSTVDITFHRAFDETASQESAYRTLINYKQQVKRILTSGGEANCEAGKHSLKKLVHLSKATNGPAILPGSGLGPANIEAIHSVVSASQYHFGKSLRKGESFAKGFDPEAFSRIKQFGGISDDGNI
ncbi:copper homeostasis protein CutC [Sediminibacillus halophilus]|uniref:PF03932 family protein CutC n=1 Tax=Sediminibacillus halophilus TaxID=482461 RepID=A0A1G9UB08_9BACI|nr:copper homeostasis protein CutC [Sediminibacillus halophilus]SDM56894.1 copper homeostasis protein [Sediminibacillus halophilus]